MKSFLKLCVRAYVGGILGMWAFVIISAPFVDGLEFTLMLISGIITTPLTPLGVPFFLGAMLALYRMNKRDEKAAILNETKKVWRPM
jgi:hypothetical protein